MLLDGARQRIQMTRSRVTAHALPRRQRGARRLYGRIDVLRAPVGNPRDDSGVRRIDDLEMIPRFRPFTVDEMAEFSVVPRNPGESVLVTLGSGAVLHRLEDFSDGCHLW